MNYAMDVDNMTKIGGMMPKLDVVKRELLHSMNELLARGLKTSFQWYVLIDYNCLHFFKKEIVFLSSGLQIFFCHWRLAIIPNHCPKK